MKYSTLLLTAVFFISCKKDATELPVEETVLPFSETTYKITVTLHWQNPQFTVPSYAHVTPFKGMVHVRDTFLWKPGLAATKGLEYVAEDGYDGFINSELDSILAHGKAISTFTLLPPAITGSVEATMNFNTDFSCFSFVSMIAPSPDWFMGVSNIDLVKNNRWVTDNTVPILLYDAGTEEGDIFGYDNPPTFPQQPIILLTPANAMVLSNGNPGIAAIGSIRFVKIN